MLLLVLLYLAFALLTFGFILGLENGKFDDWETAMMAAATSLIWPLFWLVSIGVAMSKW